MTEWRSLALYVDIMNEGHKEDSRDRLLDELQNLASQR